jgi:hypothetical protein
MNRCMTRPLHRWLPGLTGATCLLALALTAQAQTAVRNFPDQAVRATMVVVQPPEVRMDGQPMRLSPGARILGTSNTLVLSASLVGQEVTVNYVPDMLGQAHQVWILTPAEAAQKRPRLADQRNYRTAADGAN